MTEKQYGGASSFGFNGKIDVKDQAVKSINKITDDKSKKEKNLDTNLKEYTDYIKAGRIASEVVSYAKSFIKPGMKLLEIAEKIDDKISELGGKPAFPLNLSMNETAAHDTPSYNDERVASGLLKVDIGVSINGYTADTAFSLDLDNSTDNKKLIEAAQSALDNAIKTIKNGATLSEIGKAIESSIKSRGLQPIQNLSGHEIKQYDLHASLIIPNFDNSSNKEISPGVYAIEPFATNGFGSVRDGKPSGIYRIESQTNVRDSFAREVLGFIIEEYNTLPFCSRWVVKKFGSRALLALRRLEDAGILHHYPQLIEKNSGKVAQAEHTVIITEKEKIVTTVLINSS